MFKKHQVKTVMVNCAYKLKVNVLCNSSEMRFIISFGETTALAPEPDF